MAQYAKASVSEGTDIGKTSLSNEYMLCHYWYFKDVGFKFEQHVCNKYHDCLWNRKYGSVKGVAFRCTLWGICMDKAVNRLNNPEDKGVL